MHASCITVYLSKMLCHFLMFLKIESVTVEAVPFPAREISKFYNLREREMVLLAMVGVSCYIFLLSEGENDDIFICIYCICVIL